MGQLLGLLIKAEFGPNPCSMIHSAPAKKLSPARPAVGGAGSHVVGYDRHLTGLGPDRCHPTNNWRTALVGRQPGLVGLFSKKISHSTVVGLFFGEPDRCGSPWLVLRTLFPVDAATFNPYHWCWLGRFTLFSPTCVFDEKSLPGLDFRSIVVGA